MLQTAVTPFSPANCSHPASQPYCGRMTANRCAYLNTSWNTLPKQHPRPTLQSTVFATAAAAKPWPDGSKSTCLSKHVWSNTPPTAVMTLTSRDWPHYGPLYYARRPFLQNAPSSPSLAAPGTTSTFLEKMLDCIVDGSASQTPSRNSWPLSGSLPWTLGPVRVPVGVPFAVSWPVSPCSATCTDSFVSPGPSSPRTRCHSSCRVLLLIRRHRLHLVCRPPLSAPSFANLVVVAWSTRAVISCPASSATPHARFTEPFRLVRPGCYGQACSYLGQIHHPGLSCRPCHEILC